MHNRSSTNCFLLYESWLNKWQEKPTSRVQLTLRYKTIKTKQHCMWISCKRRGSTVTKQHWISANWMQPYIVPSLDWMKEMRCCISESIRRKNKIVHPEQEQHAEDRAWTYVGENDPCLSGAAAVHQSNEMLVPATAQWIVCCLSKGNWSNY